MFARLQRHSSSRPFVYTFVAVRYVCGVMCVHNCNIVFTCGPTKPFRHYPDRLKTNIEILRFDFSLRGRCSGDHAGRTTTTPPPDIETHMWVRGSMVNKNAYCFGWRPLREADDCATGIEALVRVRGWGACGCVCVCVNGSGVEMKWTGRRCTFGIFSCFSTTKHRLLL